MWLSKVMEVLEILKGWVSAGLDGVVVLRTMIERRVQPLKRRATVLCDYSRVEDPTHNTMEIIEAAKVAKQVRGLVSSRIVVTTECTVEAFLVIFWPKLVSSPGSFLFSY